MSKENEELFLCCAIAAPRIMYEAGLVEQFFGTPETRAVFNAIQAVADKGLAVDVVSVCGIDQSLSKAYVCQIADMMHSPGNWKFYRDKIVASYQRNRLRYIGKQLSALTDDANTADALETAEKELFELSTTRTGREIVDTRRLVSEVIHKVEERYNAKGKLPGLSTGLTELDCMLGGLQPNRYYVIGARPSDGKSALGLNMAAHIALREKAPVGFISAESSYTEMGMRLFSGEARINGTRLAAGMVASKDFTQLVDAGGSIQEAPLYIYDEPNVRFSELKSMARQMMARHKIQVLFVDYIQILQWHDKKIPRHEQIAEISMGLKGLSRELNIPVVALAQLRRDAEGREPEMADLGDSGQIERDADGLIFIHHKRQDDGTEKSVLLVKKNRDGAKGAVNVVFQREYVRFYETEWTRNKDRAETASTVQKKPERTMRKVCEPKSGALEIF